MNRQLNVVVNVGGNIGSNIIVYGSNIIWLVDMEVYVGGKCIVERLMLIC